MVASVVVVPWLRHGGVSVVRDNMFWSDTGIAKEHLHNFGEWQKGNRHLVTDSFAASVVGQTAYPQWLKRSSKGLPYLQYLSLSCSDVMQDSGKCPEKGHHRCAEQLRLHFYLFVLGRRVVTESWTQGLIGRLSTSPFYSGYFWDRVSLCALAGLDHSTPTGTFTMSTFYLLNWDLMNFLPGRALNWDPPDLYLPAS
jgi:hypothetical protein